MLRAAFAYHPPYYHFEERGDELRRLRSPELARLPCAQSVAALRQVGAAAYRQMIADDMRLSQAMAQAVQPPCGAAAHDAESEHHDLSVRAARSSSETGQTHEVELHLDALNRELVDRLAARRRGICLERHHRRPLRAARLHRELPHQRR